MIGKRRQVALGIHWCWLLLFTIACGGDNDPIGPKASEIQLNLTEITLDQHETVQVIPSVVDGSGALLSGVPVTFTSGNTAIVTVSNVGVVTSVGPAGTTTLQVKAAGLTRTLPVAVRGVATKVTVDPNPGTLVQKGTLQLVAKLLDRVDAPIPNATFTFESSTPTIATVSATGLVTSVGPSGIASITVRSGAFGVLTQIAVTQVATKIDVRPSPARISVGRTRQLTPRVLDAVNAEIKGVQFTFSSSAPTVVTVSTDGTLTSVGPLGSAVVTIRAQGTSLAVDVPVTVITQSHPDGVTRLIPVSGGTYAVATMSDVEAYASHYDGLVSRLDLAAGTSTLIPGSRGGLGLASSPSRREVYSGRYESNIIEIISAGTAPTVTGTITVGSMVLDLIVSPDERTLYAGLNNGTLAVIDLATRSVTTIPGTGGLLHLSLHPTMPLLYGSGSANAITEVDLAARTVRPVITGLPITSQASAVTSDGAFLYVANEGGTVEEINLATRQRGRTFANVCPAWGMRLTPDDDQLFVGCSTGDLVILDRVAGTVIKRVAGGGSRRVAISADGTLVLVGAASGGATVVR